MLGEAHICPSTTTAGKNKTRMDVRILDPVMDALDARKSRRPWFWFRPSLETDRWDTSGQVPSVIAHPRQLGGTKSAWVCLLRFSSE